MAVHKKEEILRTAETTVNLALKLGASEAEAFIYIGNSTSVGIERGQITKTDKTIDNGIGVRVQVNNSIGFAYTNVTDTEKSIEVIIKKALIAAHASRPDKNWKSLPKRKSYPSIGKSVDKNILELRSEDLVDVASSMLDAAVGVDNRVFPVEGGAGAGYAANAIANSNGVSGFDEGTIIECSLATLANKGNTVTPVCFEFNSSREYKIDPEWVGKEAAQRTISSLKTKRIETKNYNIIFTQFALQDLLYYTFINAVKADNVERNQSPFKDKLGVKVGSEELTIYDDGLLDGGLRTGIFDAEGVPHQRTQLLDRGTLRSFLYDDYTAKKQGKESTGNASRGGYLSTPCIEATNFHIQPGKITPEEMIQEADDGLLVYYLQGAHSSNPVSGEFSVVATPAWKIKNGQIEHASRGVMLAGNIFELLKNVTAVANNERIMGQLVAPWVLVENVKVIGR